MTTAQITLTDAENLALQSLSQLKGKSPEQLMHEAVVSLIAQHPLTPRLAALRGACGIWKDRDDLPRLTDLREEMDRASPG